MYTSKGTKSDLIEQCMNFIISSRGSDLNRNTLSLLILPVRRPKGVQKILPSNLPPPASQSGPEQEPCDGHPTGKTKREGNVAGPKTKGVEN